MFKIFYSWQSEIKKTRYFIRECIDLAIELARESEAFEALRDEATKDVPGSPNIVQTIFSKIDECDLFIADVSLCYESADKKKKSPNPNVLIELGYAIHAIGTNRVICVLDTEYGELEQLPFDIRQNRILHYSFNNGTKAEVKHEVAEAIFCDIRDLQNKGERIRDNESQLVVGTYNEKEKKVIRSFEPIELRSRYNGDLITEMTKNAKEYIGCINELSERMKADKAFDEESRQMMDEEDKALLNLFRTSEIADFQKKLKSITDAGDILGKNTKQVTAFEKEAMTEWMSRYCDFFPSASFFDMGSLTETTLNMGFEKDRILNGTDAEKKKYRLYQELYRKLYQIWIRTEFIHSFDGLLFIPIAIQNISLIKDDDIRIVLELEKGMAISPTKDLINHSLRDERGRICHFGLVDELFFLPKNPIVEVEFSSKQRREQTYHYTINGFEKNRETEEDYGANLQQYILMPMDYTHYNASISNLRPGEAMWLSGGILVRPDNGVVKIRYRIHSTFSSGRLSGEIEYILN